MGRWEDTLVIFTSDHGDYLGDHWLGEKELFHDCIQRVPLLVAAPGGVPGQVEHRFAEAIDLAPTILDALGLPGAPHVLEGRSLLPILRGEAVADWREAVFSELDWTFRGARAAWACRPAAPRLHDARGGLEISPLDQRPAAAALRPFAGPREFHDSGGDPAHEATRARLRQVLWKWASRLKCRTTLSWAEAEFRTDRHKAAGVFYGEW
jgi:arylsulfatase A-like enzyme